MAQDGLPFQLELDDGDGFMHFGNQTGRALHAAVVFEIVYLESFARVSTICVERKRSEREKVDRVILFERLDIGITDGNTNYGSNQRPIAGCCSHPFDIVVAPLDVKIVVIAKVIHDMSGSRPTVEDIAHNMEAVNHEMVNQMADGFQ